MTLSRYNLALLLISAMTFSGCEETPVKPSSRRLTLPDTAKVVAEGAGALTYRATEDGRVFIYDVDDDLVEAARRVRAGQQFVLSPDINSATLDGRRVMEQDLKKNHSHRLYFEAE